MSLICQRHPRYTLFTSFILLSTFLLLASQHSSPSSASAITPSYYDGPQDYASANALSNRLRVAEKIYEKTLKDRQGLVKKFGPSPEKIVMFPPDKDPWPPYTVWDFFPAAFNCPHETERIGALGDGGKWVCGLSRLVNKPDCVVYSIGINHESSYESDILSRTKHCQIWGYDYSVKEFGPEIDAHSPQARRTHFKPYGLAGTDKHGPADEIKMYTLNTLMKMNGHKHIDILKIDIESWEFETLTTLLSPYIQSNTPLPFGQLQLEIHIWDKRFDEFLRWFEMLEKAGLRPFWTEPNLVYQNYNREVGSELAEYSFINIRGDNIFITEPGVTGEGSH